LKEPETLGEYRDLCAVLGGEDCAAVAFIDRKISESPNGRSERVLTDSSQMLVVLGPMLLQKEGA
jgi:hypothetical protein